MLPLLLALLLGPPAPPPASLTPAELLSAAHTLARDEGWPIDQPGYTFDPMVPTVDDGFASIGLYRNAHLLRMYSIHRATGDIVDFMHGCDLLQYDDLKPLQARIRKASHASPIPPERLAAQVGCPRLNLIDNRWVK